MKKKLQWKVIVVLLVVIFCVFFLFPRKDAEGNLIEPIQRGLDLKGGIHLVLEVQTDDAVDMETNQEILRLTDILKKNNITYKVLAKTEGRVGEFQLQSYDAEKDDEVRDILKKYFKDWDVSYAGTTATLTLKPAVMNFRRDQAVKMSRETIENRVDELGLTEPTIQRDLLHGNRIILELPGVEEPDRVKNIIKTTAMLKWQLVVDGPADDAETLLEKYGGNLPEDLEILQGDPRRSDEKYYVLQKVAPITGKDLQTARQTTDQWNKPAVLFTLKPDGARRFYKFTSDNLNKPLSIVLDNKIQEVATIRDRIPDTGTITGSFTSEEAEDLALVLRAGALPASIKYLEERAIGPSLGADSIRKGLKSIIIALILIFLFMVFYYKVSGINAITALLFNILIIGGVLAYFKKYGASLTLPGMAGIILTIGMAVDANVLIFERIREELAQGKSVVSSISAGFSRAFRTILDANITTIIACVFLFQFGTGPLRGFAVTLIIGITASMFTAVFVSRLIFDLFLQKRKKSEKLSI